MNVGEEKKKSERPKNLQVAQLLDSNLADSMEMMNISGSSPSATFPRRSAYNQPATPFSALVLPARLTCTSTPSASGHLLPKQASPELSTNHFTFSQRGCKSQKTLVGKASDVFDISDSFMVMDIDTSKTNMSVCNQPRTPAENMSESSEDSFDRFDLAT